MTNNDALIEQKEIEAIETEDEKITRMALEWIDTGKSGKMAPASIRKRVLELKPSNKALRAIDAVKRKEQRVLVQRHNMDMFLEEYLNNGGNATVAAKKVLGLSSDSGAVVAGERYLQQARLIGRLQLEKRGYTAGKMLDVALEKMEQSRNPDWWDRLMKIAEYSNPIADKKNVNQTVNIFQTQKQDADEFGFDDVIEGEMEDEVEEENTKVLEEDNAKT